MADTQIVKPSDNKSWGVLSDRAIKHYCTQIHPPLVSPWNEKCAKPASYELHVGDEYRRSSDETVKRVGKNEIITLLPNEIGYILTEEEINIPKNICGFIFPRQSRVLRGILMYPQPPIQPGSSGKLYVLLHNLSNKEIDIRQGEHLATLVLMGLCEGPGKSYGERDGDIYDKQKTLTEIGATRVYKPLLKDLSERIDRINEDTKSFRERLISWYYPIMLGVLTVITMILSIMMLIRAAN